MTNYPDDMSRFNDNPCSPEYDGPTGMLCDQCSEYTELDDMADDVDVCKECFKEYTCVICLEYKPDTVDMNGVCEECNDF